MELNVPIPVETTDGGVFLPDEIAGMFPDGVAYAFRWHEPFVHYLLYPSYDGIEDTFRLYEAVATDDGRFSPIFARHAKLVEAFSERNVEFFIEGGELLMPGGWHLDPPNALVVRENRVELWIEPELAQAMADGTDRKLFRRDY